jgi:hypothetical protein
MNADGTDLHSAASRNQKHLPRKHGDAEKTKVKVKIKNFKEHRETREDAKS